MCAVRRAVRGGVLNALPAVSRAASHPDASLHHSLQGIPDDSPLMYTVLNWIRHIEENYLLEDDQTGPRVPGLEVPKDTGVASALGRAVGGVAGVAGGLFGFGKKS